MQYDLDGMCDLLGALVRLAVKDYQLGPGNTAEQSRNYQSALEFLKQHDLFEPLGLDAPAPVSDFWTNGAQLTEVVAWAKKDKRIAKQEYIP